MALRRGKMWEVSIRVTDEVWDVVSRQAFEERRGVCNMAFVLLEEALRARGLLPKEPHAPISGGRDKP